jgi:tight adherence protein G
MMMKHNMIKQKGVAAIWMAMLLVPIMGFTFFAVEGTRYVQESSRLNDASEAAALAMTIADNGQNNNVAANTMAQNYIKAYVRDIKNVNVSFIRSEPMDDDGNPQFIQYVVNATTTHKSWFSSEFIPSFDETQDILGRATAKKYPVFLGDKNIDIVFVADFSGSMNNDWSGSRGQKITALKDAIKDISAKVLIEDEDTNTVTNRIGFTPFNHRVQEKDSDNKFICMSQLRYNNYQPSGTGSIHYEEVNWQYWSSKNKNYVKDCKNDKDDCKVFDEFSSKRKQRKHAKRVWHVLYEETNDVDGLLERPKYIDFNKSVNDVFNDKTSSNNFHFYSINNKLYSSAMCNSSGSFWSIPLTENLADIDSIQNMNANGYTAVYQGLIRAAQLMKSGQPKSDDALDDYNKRIKMILILSDGQEYPYKETFQGLVSNSVNICDKIRDEFKESEQELYIGVLGIDFSASAQSGFQKCVKDEDEDIIDVKNKNDLIKKIEELIAKGSRSSGTTKLY